MSLFSRRSILSRFVASVPAAAIAGSAPALASPASVENISPAVDPGEDSEIRALGQQFEWALTELMLARENHAAAKQKFLALVPPLPTKLILSNEDNHWMGGARTDVFSVGHGWRRREIETPDYQSMRYPTRWRAIAELLRSVKDAYPAHSERGRFVRRLLPIAENYERGVKTAARKSKILAACERFASAEYKAADLARSLARTKPLTWAGLRAKAAAVSSADECGQDARFHIKTLGAEHLSADILRLTDRRGVQS
jgi:hypothetical protein